MSKLNAGHDHRKRCGHLDVLHGGRGESTGPFPSGHYAATANGVSAAGTVCDISPYTLIGTTP